MSFENIFINQNDLKGTFIELDHESISNNLVFYTPIELSISLFNCENLNNFKIYLNLICISNTQISKPTF